MVSVQFSKFQRFEGPMNLSERWFCGSSRTARASNFNSTYRRSNSSRPSQPPQRSAKLPRKRENRPEVAFRVFDLVSRLPNRQSLGANWRKSLATSANIPVFQRLSSDHDCGPRAAVKFAIFSRAGVTRTGSRQSCAAARPTQRFDGIRSRTRINDLSVYVRYCQV